MLYTKIIEEYCTYDLLKVDTYWSNILWYLIGYKNIDVQG